MRIKDGDGEELSKTFLHQNAINGKESAAYRMEFACSQFKNVIEF